MTQLDLKRGISALGISLAVAVAAFASTSQAQPQPLTSPQYPGAQYQTPQYPPPPPPGSQSQNPQYPAPPPPPQYGRQGQYGQGPGFNRGPADRGGGENRLDRRLALLHQRIGITPAQESAWTEFAGEMRSMATQARETMPGRERGTGNIVQRLELREHMLERRSADLDRTLRALRPLFASLSDEQRRTANQLLFRPERRGFAGGPGFRNAPPQPGYGPGFAPGYNRTPG